MGVIPHDEDGERREPGSAPQTVTFLATAHLSGELGLLPRLFTLIHQERCSAQGPVVLLDLGDTCAVQSWVCRATLGRAPFLVLDSMGYDGAVIGGPEQAPIPPSSLRLLAGQMIMPVIIWNRPRTLTKRGVTFTVAPGNPVAAPEPPALVIDRSTEVLPAPGSSPPVLGDVAQGCLLRVDVTWPAWTVREARLLALSGETPPDATIAAIVTLVEDEAWQLAQPQGGSDDTE
ncbi:MAG: hypothetical protein OZ934_13450 [Anaerolineae bacterium]|nr:hypothetical protein [Anaerolineae bacterium]